MAWPATRTMLLVGVAMEVHGGRDYTYEEKKKIIEEEEW